MQSSKSKTKICFQNASPDTSPIKPSSTKHLCLQVTNSAVGVAALEAIGADIPVAQSDWAAAPVDARTTLVKRW
jgi:hypothetical protein